MSIKRRIETMVLVVILLVGICLWQCPIEKIFGIPCPGCMMTTALYYFIKFDFEKAFYFNPAFYLLLLMFLPLCFSLKRNKKVFKVLLVLTVVGWLLIYIYRMMTLFPEYPMPYVRDNLIERVFR